MTTLAERAIEARETAGYAEGAEWARAIGITPQAIYQIESGKTQDLGAKTMAAMERLSGLRGEWIRTGKPPKQSISEALPPIYAAESRPNMESLPADAALAELQQIVAALVAAMAQHRPAEAGDVAEALAPLLSRAEPGSLLAALSPRLAKAKGWRAAR